MSVDDQVSTGRIRPPDSPGNPRSVFVPSPKRSRYDGEAVPAEVLGQEHRADVRGLGEDVGHRPLLDRVRVVVGERVVPERVGVGHGEDRARLGDLLLQGGAHGDDLVDRAGLEHGHRARCSTRSGRCCRRHRDRCWPWPAPHRCSAGSRSPCHPGPAWPPPVPTGPARPRTAAPGRSSGRGRRPASPAWSAARRRRSCGRRWPARSGRCRRHPAAAGCGRARARRCPCRRRRWHRRPSGPGCRSSFTRANESVA